ncbi:hypothetical protein SFRURICE_008374 [Spodoptera frugiperda]|nr:hypothetical protein SFRURICE_008374 [Spodoptera frugiperda]
MFFKTVVFSILILFSAQTTSGYELNILHYNDFHARFVETNRLGGPCNQTADTCIGGFARLATVVRQRLDIEPHSLLLNAGDSFQGTIWYNVLRWNVTQDFMNMLPHDAHFDNGIEGVVPYLQHLNSTVVTANIIDDLEPTIQGLYEKSIIVEKNNRKIGIIGVLIATTDILASTGRLKFTDEIEAVREEAGKLNAQGVDIIVVLSHCGLDIDREIALHAGPHVDIIVGGHSHTLLFNGDAPENSGFTPLGPYPVVVEQGNRKVLIVQAAAHTQYLGEIKLTFDDNGHLTHWTAQDVLDKIEEYLPQIEEKASEEIGSSLALPRAGPSQWNYAHFCVNNRGVIRAAIDSGVITYEGLIVASPFENNVEVFDLKGEHIMEMLEFSVENEQWPGGRLLQVAGLRVTFNGSRPVNSRVVDVQVRCIECDVPRYEPLRLDKYYKVASQSFIANGGDGYSMISENRRNIEVLGVDYDILSSYIEHQSPVFAQTEGRVPYTFRFMETSPAGTICNPNADPCIGGFARLATLVRERQAAESNSLLLNAGDSFQGTIWYNIGRWNVTQDFMNMLDHDAHTLASTGKLRFTDEVQAVREEAAKLNAQGVDIIIVLSHCGLDIDREIAMHAGPHIDIIVGGHSHTLLFNGDAPENSGFTPLGPYPVVVEQASRKVLIVQAAAHTQYLGEIKLTFDDNGHLLRWAGNPHYIGNDVVQAPDVLEKIDYYLPRIQEEASKVVGSSLVHLSSDCACSECNLGNLICDAFLHSVIPRAGNNSWNYAHFCVINQGGIRMHIDEGEITLESLLLSTPFENRVEVFDLKGEHIMEMLEYAVANEPYAGARMLQVSGLRASFDGSRPRNARVIKATVRCIECDVPRYEPLRPDKYYKVLSQSFLGNGGDGIRAVFDGARPLGNRVVDVTIRCIECDIPRYEPLSTEKYYKVASTNFIGNGGGDYTMVSNNRKNVEDVGMDYEIIKKYLEQYAPVYAERDGRMQISNPCIV